MRCTYVDRKGRQCIRYGTHLLHAYAPLAKTGARARRERSDLNAARAKVKQRSLGMCEAAFERIDDRYGSEDAHFICGTWKQHPAAHVHHIAPSDRDRGLHDPERMRHVCTTAHDWIHSHPERAHVLGLLERSLG